MVSRTDITRMEETEKPKHPKHLDVGRICIEETPEEKQEVIKRDVLKRDEVRPRYKDTEARYEVERRPKSQGKEDVVEVGRLDVTDYQKKTMEFEPEKEKTTYTERLGKKPKVCLLKCKLSSKAYQEKKHCTELNIPEISTAKIFRLLPA